MPDSVIDWYFRFFDDEPFEDAVEALAEAEDRLSLPALVRQPPHLFDRSAGLRLSGRAVA